MIGILIVAHKSLGKSLIECATHMLGEKPQQLVALAVKSKDDPDILLQEAQTIIKEINSGDGVLVFSDIYGGTPCNIATKLVGSSHSVGLSGINLPMLIVALSNRKLPLNHCLEKTINDGRESIVHFTEIGCIPHD